MQQQSIAFFLETCVIRSYNKWIKPIPLLTMFFIPSTISLETLWDRDTFITRRSALLPMIRTLKKMRTVTLGEHITILFEHTNLVWWHIQEMVRIENGGKDQMMEEINVYQPLLPTKNTITMTVMLAFGDVAMRKKNLEKLLGFESMLTLSFGKEHYTLTSGPIPDNEPPLSFLTKTTSVHFLHFILPDDKKVAFAEGDIHISSIHPLFAHTHLLSIPLQEALINERL